MKVLLHATSGKNVGLHFYGIDAETRLNVRQLIGRASFFDCDYRDVVCEAHPFYQCDSTGYLFIEFWSQRSTYIKLVDLMRSRLGLNIEEREPTNDDYALIHAQEQRELDSLGEAT